MEENNCLILFAKPPVKGWAKTRIAAIVGDDQAFAVYAELLNRTLNTISKVRCTKVVFVYQRNGSVWKPPYNFGTKSQKGADLGERMKNAFEWAFQSGFQKAIIVGSDCFELSSEIIEEGFSGLSDHDCVLGPAMDGGYYLIGSKKLIPEVFDNIKWSTDQTFKQTRDILVKSGRSYQTLKQIRDVDTYEDVLHYEDLRILIEKDKLEFTPNS